MLYEKPSSFAGTMLPILLLFITTIFGSPHAIEHSGAKKSIIPRHASEKGALYDIKEPADALYKRSRVGSTFDSGVLHKLEDFLLKRADGLEMSPKKSEIEDEKEVETIAEEDLHSESGTSNAEKMKSEFGEENGKEKIETKESVVNENRRKSLVSKSKKETKEEEKQRKGTSEKKEESEMGQKNDMNKKGLKEKQKKLKAERKKDNQAAKRDNTKPNEEENDAEYGR